MDAVGTFGHALAQAPDILRSYAPFPGDLLDGLPLTQ